MLDVNESASAPDGARIEASDFDAASEYKVNKSEDRPSMPASIVLWSKKWLLVPLMVLFSIIFALTALAAAIIDFLFLMLEFFTAIAAPNTLENHGPWITLGLGLIPILLSISVVSFRLTQQFWAKLHGEKELELKKENISGDRLPA